ncbi:MAG: copper-translocating P-type ATPase [Candidatus Zambryskibacteria bacterium CG11_big_fil_rev_8_21_14_0_20_40_24]|uniref:Copper-translocating P-type ATPase n=1 Tax=Candidatus Zambryskibacteria bacterium CG11_big_fil_rev_8_21_14_0_20_40_24 TaxID=1975116 RepID=A0A2H0K6S0_9BACT|nr:MAG: copper-translocating P-type ATPase [Candidatus Zambryskibacteria bacterium CG11_big_fil_rev_8_21_14_0_20_40_24]
MEHSYSGAHCGVGQPSAMGHGSALVYLRKFWIVTFLLIPLFLVNKMISGFFGYELYSFAKWIGFVIASIIFGFSLIFFQHAWHEIKMRKYGMMTLVSIAVGSGFIFSVVSTFIPSLNVEFYLEISTLIWVLLFGHYLEAKSSSAAGNALQEVAKLLPKKAHRLVGDKSEEVDTSLLKEGDVVLVKPGEKIPADGVVNEGTANVNESLISGESKPVEKKEHNKVIAGSICLDGSLTIKLSRVGENSTIGQIQKLINQAQNTKPRSQRLADKASSVLTLVAVITSLLTIFVWSIILGKPLVFGITLAITVLVIACPHALGLAIPTVTTIATSLAVKNGVFIKNLAKIEVIRNADYVVFDKTGTLTKGQFGVSDIVTFGSMAKNDIAKIAASLEQHSAHIIGQSILQYAEKNHILLDKPKQFRDVAGKGVIGVVNEIDYFLGNKPLIKDMSVLTVEQDKKINDLSLGDNTIVILASKKELLGIITMSDEIKPESFEVVKKLHNLGVKVAMLTGDKEDVAEKVAKELNIDTYFAEVLPEQKYKYVKQLQEDGNIVLMVGDGVNDAPALTQANVGIAIGAGTDVAVEAGDVVLTRNNPMDVVRLLVLSKKVYVKMVQNLFWALGYNILAIPAAAGVFVFWGIFLRPEIGALLMSMSTVIVVMNAMTLKKINLQTV